MWDERAERSMVCEAYNEKRAVRTVREVRRRSRRIEAGGPHISLIFVCISRFEKRSLYSAASCRWQVT